MTTKNKPAVWIGTRVKYPGDWQNPMGEGEIVAVHANPWYGTVYDVRLDDGREFPTSTIRSFMDGNGPATFQPMINDGE